ncbi:MAG: hypothetical protein KDI82_02070 [Gammaproteobacteria bacterium]|nr:hypothetical protein [Gammaproteobacteria bacterium]
MNHKKLPIKTSLVFMGALLAGCSGPSEDVRVSFCKNISAAYTGAGENVEWTANNNTFRRPEYAIAELQFNVIGSDGSRTAKRTECYFAYDVVEDTAQHLADPFSAYSTLPFAMKVDGQALSDGELVQLRNAEQVRLGRAAVATLEKGARDLADKVRAGIGQ